MTIELLDGRRVAVRPLAPPAAGEPAADREVRLRLAELARARGGAARERAGRRLVRAAIARELPAETPRSLAGLCHRGHPALVARALAREERR